MEKDPTVKSKRILVSIPIDTYNVLKEKFKGAGFGYKDSEIIRNIVISYLSEKGYMK